jgi:PAS domain S-box-containing protein
MGIVKKVILLVSLSVAVVMGGVQYASICRTAKVAHSQLEDLLHLGLDFASQVVLERSQSVIRIVFFKSLDGVYLGCNQRFADYLGRSREKIIGCTDYDFVPKETADITHPDDIQANALGKQVNFSELWKVIGKGKTWRGMLTNRKKDGGTVHLETAISPIRNVEGTVANYLALMRDVTNEVLLQKQLAQSQKMEAIGTLAGGIAHDFNNIIFAITGYTELALEEMPNGCQAQADLQRVLEGAARAGEMVKQILAFSRQGQHERRVLNLSPIVKEGLKFLRASIPSTVQIQQKIESGLGKVYADPTQIHQVLMNLCTNAAHSMRDTKGILTVILAGTRVDNVFAEKHPPLVPGPHVTLTVADSGHGIPPELLDRIFDPYFTTKQAGEGTGLGLSVLHGIVKSHGGVVTVSSEPQQGTTFVVYLPVTDDQETIEDIEASIQVLAGHERILLVDDEQIVIEMEQATLERLGYEVVAHMNPLQSVEAFKAAPQEFDLVLTDLTMPRMTGIELGSELIAIRPDIPMILCTGFSQKLTDEDLKKAGFQALIAKPMLKKDVAKTIREVLDNYDKRRK